MGALLAWANKGPADVLTPMQAVIELVRWCAFIAGVVWGPLLFAALWIGLAAVWGGRPPASHRTPVDAARGPAGRRRTDRPVHRLHRGGVEVDVTLPSGVSTDEIQKRRRKLAS